MNSILYAICFCIVGFAMWFSIGFSFVEKKYDIDVIFNSWNKIIIVFGGVIFFSGTMTFLSYIIVSRL